MAIVLVRYWIISVLSTCYHVDSLLPAKQPPRLTLITRDTPSCQSISGCFLPMQTRRCCQFAWIHVIELLHKKSVSRNRCVPHTWPSSPAKHYAKLHIRVIWCFIWSLNQRELTLSLCFTGCMQTAVSDERAILDVTLMSLKLLQFHVPSAKPDVFSQSSKSRAFFCKTRHINCTVLGICSAKIFFWSFNIW